MNFASQKAVPRVPSDFRLQELPQNSWSRRVIFWSLFCRDSWEYGHPAPRCSNESSRSCEAAHADVQLTTPVGPQLHPDSVEDRGLGGLLPELHHAADHEHSLPVHPLHHL